MTSAATLPPARLRVAILGALASFAGLAVLAVGAPAALAAIDVPMSEFARGSSYSSAFRDVSLLGATEVAVLFAMVVGLLLWQRCRAAALIYPAAILASAALNVVLKTAIDRPRPPAPATATALASFPSGHSFQVTVVLGLLPVLCRHVGVPQPLALVVRLLALTGIVAVGVSRVYLGAHWVTDVVAGVLVGAVVVLGTERLLTRNVPTVCHCPAG
ncbi:MAG: phosphatase PAP2 family protein [Microthrixaceae bacterium]|nr:phosphatase PAP2 family protein [Microthrixaceae bacterium]